MATKKAADLDKDVQALMELQEKLNMQAGLGQMVRLLLSAVRPSASVCIISLTALFCLRCLYCRCSSRSKRPRFSSGAQSWHSHSCQTCPLMCAHTRQSAKRECKPCLHTH